MVVGIDMVAGVTAGPSDNIAVISADTRIPRVTLINLESCSLACTARFQLALNL
jgi:hypothetical protein